MIIETHQHDNRQDIDFSEGKQLTKEQETAIRITGLMGNTSTDVVRVHLSDIENGLLDTSTTPRGSWRSSWVMYLSKQPCRNMDRQYYNIVLTAPMAVLSEHIRSCATA